MPLFGNEINTNVGPITGAKNTNNGFDIYINNLNMTVETLARAKIDVSGLELAVDASAQLTVFKQISATELKKLLIISVDSDDVTNADIDEGTDISFVAPKTSNLTTLKTQCDAFDASFNTQTVESQSIGGVQNTSVGDDFTRYLAAKLFNTYKAVDLFSNESEISESVDVSYGELYENLTTDATYIAEKIFKHIIAADTENSRLYDMSGSWKEASGNLLTDATLPDNSVVGEVPLKSGDRLIFNVTVKPAADQHTLTGVSEIGNRVYRVILDLS